MRLVFTADRADASGLQAFELPLAYISEEDFRQPIFTGGWVGGVGPTSARRTFFSPSLRMRVGRGTHQQGRLQGWIWLGRGWVGWGRCSDTVWGEGCYQPGGLAYTPLLMFCLALADYTPSRPCSPPTHSHAPSPPIHPPPPLQPTT